ncbi:MAG: hypothetical protein H0T43_11750, partial [Solirubrobacterales bacterium]|nr:hypothetical protein [Solirubrobacterales bacterium]
MPSVVASPDPPLVAEGPVGLFEVAAPPAPVIPVATPVTASPSPDDAGAPVAAGVE